MASSLHSARFKEAVGTYFAARGFPVVPAPRRQRLSAAMLSDVPDVGELPGVGDAYYVSLIGQDKLEPGYNLKCATERAGDRAPVVIHQRRDAPLADQFVFMRLCDFADLVASAEGID